MEEHMTAHKIRVVCLDNDVTIECFRHETLGLGRRKTCDAWRLPLIFCELD